MTRDAKPAWNGFLVQKGWRGLLNIYVSMTVRTGQFQRVRDVGGGTVNHHCATRAKHWEHPVCIRIIHLDCSLPWEKRKGCSSQGAMISASNVLRLGHHWIQHGSSPLHLFLGQKFQKFYMRGKSGEKTKLMPCQLGNYTRIRVRRSSWVSFAFVSFEIQFEGFDPLVHP